MSGAKWVYRTALVILWGATAFSLLGIALLEFAPAYVARPEVARSLPTLMRAPTWIYMLAFPIAVFAAYLPAVGVRRSLGLFLWASALGLAAELIGTGTGWPFGPYSYTTFLEPKVLGAVPVLIPLSWYAIAMVSLDLAGPSSGRRWRTVAVGAAFMVLWDVALDPPMAARFPVWQWHVDGFFYGMPAINWAGWFVTSWIILAGMERWLGGIPRGQHAIARRLWGASLVLPLGMAALNGMAAALGAGVAAAAIPLVLGRASPARVTAPASAAPLSMQPDRT